MKISQLISGSTGLIGSHLMDGLREVGANPQTINRNCLVTEASVASDSAGALLDSAVWLAHFQQLSSGKLVIYHFAAQTSAQISEMNPSKDYESNVLVIKALVEGIRDCRRLNSGFVPLVVFASTATVYGCNPPLPVNEQSTVHLCTTYDRHKYHAEEELRLAQDEGLLEAIVLRLPNVYGSMRSRSVNDRGVLERWIEQAFHGDPLLSYSGGNFLRDYLHILDLTRLLVSMGTRSGFDFGIFNPGSGESHTIREVQELIAELVRDKSGVQSKVQDVNRPANALEIDFRNYRADISRSQKVFGWTPHVGLRQGIAGLISNFG